MWRSYCDALHASLLHRWLEDARFTTALKTDLFDEAHGDGLAAVLQQISARATGIDISRSVAQHAAVRHPALETRTADVRKLPFENGSFGFVLSNSTLDRFEDSRDLENSVREIVRVLAPGGTLLLTLDNPLNPVVSLRNKLPATLFGRTSLAPYFVGHTLSLAPMVRLLASCGCETHRKGYVMHVPRIIFLHLSRWFDPTTSAGSYFLRFMNGFESLARQQTPRHRHPRRRQNPAARVGVIPASPRPTQKSPIKGAIL